MILEIEILVTVFDAAEWCAGGGTIGMAKVGAIAVTKENNNIR